MKAYIHRQQKKHSTHEEALHLRTEYNYFPSFLYYSKQADGDDNRDLGDLLS